MDRPVSPRFLRDLTGRIGPDSVVTDPDRLAGPCIDWTGRFRGSTVAMALPRSTTEVAAVLGACREHDVPVTVQGGNTGLVGGSVPLGGELLLSLRRLDQVTIDDAAGQATAQAGVSIGRLQDAARRRGWEYGVDLASRDSATVGGTVGTNAGGLRMVRYGATRHQLLGVEAVLGDGSVVSHLQGLVKDNTGYDLAGLLCGSEGTLGVVTAARLRLVPPAAERAVALLGFADVAAAVGAAREVRRGAEELEAVELFLDHGLELVCRVTGAARPIAPAPAYLLVELAGHGDLAETLAEVVASLPSVTDSALATGSERRADLWAYRERHTDVVNSLGPPHKLDVTLPFGELASFIDQVPSVVAAAAPSADVYQWGHAGDGNVHVNLVGLEPDDLAADEAVLAEVVRRGGSISAEHGIGTAKRRWLGWCRSEAEIAAFRALKAALDPGRILSPSVLLPPGAAPPPRAARS